ncbi:CD225/dispanin family protein [Nocardiopsis sp. HUAS JQ3]|uniref:CD225/dispanin family protein n=1 Tax=Nocardiopsis sp. HUAS JQ3 TaxID=3061629 RepID=UPI0023AA04DB|nr:CD225/dispanin family protein [Nocardiopsis sp. HUAS JQ3]WDZ89334.1 CD225/dispanin family protein [Nocardiopsis sp. HUAS JQ3]
MSYGPPPPGNPGPPPGGGYGPPSGGYGAPSGPPPDNGLVWAIVAIFCCWPFAIPGIVNSTKVNDLWNRGDHAGAMEAQKQAKKWTKIAFICGGILWALLIAFYVVLFFVVGAAATAPTYTTY